MATPSVPQTLEAQTDLLEKLTTPPEGLLTKRLLEARIASMREETAGSANLVLSGAETPPDRMLTFKQAREFLDASDIDLEELRADHVRDAIRWNRIKPNKTKKYAAQFDSAKLSENDMRQLVAEIQAGKRFSAVFLPAGATFEDEYQCLIVDAGIKHAESQSLANYKQQTPHDKPRIAFIPQITDHEDGFTFMTADQEVIFAQKRNIKLLDPAMWPQLFRQSADRGLRALFPKNDLDQLSPEAYKQLLLDTLSNPDSGIDPYLLDCRTITRFPNHRDKSGRALGFYWDPSRDYRHVFANGWDPLGRDPLLGFRRFLG